MTKYLILLLAVLAILPSASALDLYYNVTMTYDKGEVTLDSISVVPLDNYDPLMHSALDGYSAILSNDQEILDIYHFDFNLDVYAVTQLDINGMVTGSENLKREKHTTNLYMPYDKQASTIEVVDRERNTVLNIDIMPTQISDLPEEKAAEIKPAEEKKITTSNIILIGALALVVLILSWLALREKEK